MIKIENDIFEAYLNKIEIEENRLKLRDLFDKIGQNYPMLEKRIAWNQPMFTYKGSFIIGFSSSKNHFSISGERKALLKFEEDIKESGYSYGKEIFRITWLDKINMDLIYKIIDFNIKDKEDYKYFWRK